MKTGFKDGGANCWVRNIVELIVSMLGKTYDINNKGIYCNLHIVVEYATYTNKMKTLLHDKTYITR